MILLGAALLARRNLRLGRGDRRGAFRLAAFCFVLEIIAWLTAGHHVPEVAREVTLFLECLAYGLLLSCPPWLVYIAVEPSVRRRWPGVIIRRWWAAVGALFLLMTLLGSVTGEHPSVDWLFGMLSAALVLVVLLRFGLLAAVFMQFFGLAFFFFPMTTDFSAWYAGSTAFGLAACLALILFGFRTSLAGQTLFRGSLVED